MDYVVTPLDRSYKLRNEIYDIGFTLDKHHNFVNGKAIISKDGRMGVIDKSGTTVIPFEYNYINFVGFHRGGRFVRMRFSLI